MNREEPAPTSDCLGKDREGCRTSPTCGWVRASPGAEREDWSKNLRKGLCGKVTEGTRGGLGRGDSVWDALPAGKEMLR